MDGLFGVVDGALDWIGEAAGGVFDWASSGVSDLFSVSTTDVAGIFSKGTLNDVIKLLGGQGGTAGAAQTLLGLLRGGLGAYTDIARSDFLREKYLNEAKIYQENLDLLGIETPLAISKIMNEMGWARTSTDLRVAQSLTESTFTQQLSELRGDQLDARIAALLEQRAAEDAIFPLRARALDTQAAGIRGQLDVRTKILRGEIDAVTEGTDLDVRSLDNQKQLIGEIAAFEAGTRRLRMVREIGQSWVTAAHYGVMTGGVSSAGNNAAWAHMMGQREIDQINRVAGLRMAGIDIAIQKERLQAETTIKRMEGELELMNITSGTQLAQLDIDKLILAATQRAAAANTAGQVAQLAGEKEILKTQTAWSLAKGSFDRNFMEAQLAATLAGNEVDLDLIEARATSRGRILSLQIASSLELAGLAESQGDISLLARGADMLLGPGLTIASNLWGSSSTKTTGVATDYSTGIIGEYQDVGGLGTE